MAVLPISGARAAGIFYIRGGGNGHGIGLSQYGAYGYALHGAGYQSILAHYYQGTALGATSPDQPVRVLLSTGTGTVSGASSAGATRLDPTQVYTVKVQSDGRLILLDAANRRVGPAFVAPLVVTGPAPLTVPGVGSFRGALEFRPDGQGGVQTVNAVALDDYVRGVVAAEMPSGWAPQALEAQAVAARTYAITTTVSGNGYNLYDDTRSQMYGGVGAETPATDAAVLATRGQVVTYQGHPVVTYFFASSGGYTENIENAWPGSSPEPWLRGVADPYDAAGGDPYHRWSMQLSLRAAAAKLGGLLRGGLIGITVTRHGVSPRILQASVTGTQGTTTVTGGQLQQAFGLLTTDAAFTTITTNAVVNPPGGSPGAGGAGAAGGGAAGLSGSAGANGLIRHAVAYRLSGSVFPARAGTTYLIQQLRAAGWQTIGRARLKSAGSYLAPVPGAGTYRIQILQLNGPPVVAAPKRAAAARWAAARQELSALLRLQRGQGPALPVGRLARYAWPLAGDRRPLRPVPLLLRPAGQHQRRR
ncbi:MAG TPA: SpoIID/LytB domain-containing protein [Solirubrobacteraceae bacterium]